MDPQGNPYANDPYTGGQGLDQWRPLMYSSANLVDAPAIGHNMLRGFGTIEGVGSVELKVS